LGPLQNSDGARKLRDARRRFIPMTPGSIPEAFLNRSDTPPRAA